MAAINSTITGDVTEGMVTTGDVTMTNMVEDVAAWATGDVTTTRAARDVVADMEVITGVEMNMMVRRATICATRARVKADTPDRKQGGHG